MTHIHAWTEERVAHLVAALAHDGVGGVETSTGWAALVQLLDKQNQRPTDTETCASTAPQAGSTTPAKAATCTDDVESCAVWAAAGECRSNPDFMLRSCRRSCSQCERALSMPDTQEEPDLSFCRASPWVSTQPRNSALFVRTARERLDADIGSQDVYDLCRASCEQSGPYCWAFEVPITSKWGSVTQAAQRSCTLWSRSDSFTSVSV